ncbi:hypothetical protein BD779DRAFT_1550746 [Infundibulicybe gibba]|nr:hypothetical protein BD779DRAFT_1550746 [Infundibulicybe gibba]
MNADPIPDLELEYHRLERQAMLFKTFSLCALIFSSVASAAAQALQPGRYTITSVFSGPSANRGNVMLRDPGSDQWAVIPDISTIGLLENRDKWDLTPGQNGGFIIQNVQFSTFLTVGPANLDVPVRSTQGRTQAASFAITNAGSGTYHVRSNQTSCVIVGTNTRTLRTLEDSGGWGRQLVDGPDCYCTKNPAPRLGGEHELECGVKLWWLM